MADTILDILGSGEGTAPALVVPGGPTLSFDDLREQVEVLAGQLAGAGIGPRDAVALVLPNGPEAAIGFLAVAACAVAAPLNPAYREEEFRFYLYDLQAKALITSAAQPNASAEAAAGAILKLELAGEAGHYKLRSDSAAPSSASPRFASPDDVSLVLHTSGTTARPKIVPLTHANLTASATNIVRSLRLSPDDRCLNAMPLFHIHGIVAALLSSLRAGSSVVATPGFDAFRFFAWLEETSPTWYTAVPTMHQLILSRADRQSEVIRRHPLRFMRSSSASLPPVVMERLEAALGTPMIEAYGMTEAAHQMASNPLPPGKRKPGSVGVATGVEIGIMGDDGNLLEAGSTGEVVIRGANVTKGYANNPEANAASFTNGWFRTGDQGYQDGDGYLYLTGRLKEIINRGGEKVSPREVDEALLDHPAVAQAVAFAVPHERLGEEVAAAVVLADGASASERELRDHAARRLADFKVPRTILILDEIPKGPTGKVVRIGLAEQLLGSGRE
jgi:oxalate---CoA ligase